MTKARWGWVTALVLTASTPGGASEAADPIDFGRDVRPLFRAHCYECHGPRERKNFFRLDQRRAAMRGGTGVMIGPGNADGSRLYRKLVDKGYRQMPPSEPLKPEQIEIVKAWIDQGAKWPDEFAGDPPSEPVDPKATRLMEAIRAGDDRMIGEMLKEDPRIAGRKGPGGTTPLMYAALYGDVGLVRRLLDSGADPNLKNEVGAAALMWAVDDLEKVRLLVARGADVNARSEDGRTPLAIATTRYGSLPVVRFLLDSGANPSVTSASYKGTLSPLSEAADVGDADVLRLLMERGADPGKAGPEPLIFAIVANDQRSVDLLFPKADRQTMSLLLGSLGPPFGNPTVFGDATWVKRLLDRGADVNARGPGGRTILLNMVNSDIRPLESIATLIERGADLNATSDDGRTALDLARLHGSTPVVDLLAKAGVKPGKATPVRPNPPKPADSPRAALSRSLPLLQRTDAAFLQRTGCVSCHHNTLTMMTVASARRGGVPVDEKIARSQAATIASYIEGWRERAIQGLGIPGDSESVSSILVGLAAEHQPADPATDALARYLLSRQSPDGHWLIKGHRPPLESSVVGLTAASMRAIQVYAPKTRRNEYDKGVERAREWLKRAQPRTSEDRAFQLLGLRWAGESEESLRRIADDYLNEQRADGGWGQVSSLASDAYATGQALTVLREAGVLAPTDPAYRRGVEFLRSTQLEDGSWYVASRSVPFQPYFESGFPHGIDQWISVAATNWAAMALVPVAGP